jgi:hypothetical protein
MEDFIKICSIKDEIEANYLSAQLQEREIPHLIRSFHDSAYDGIFQMQKGWGALYAPESFRADIEKIRQETDSLSDADTL